jgi:hypothetical protein
VHELSSAVGRNLGSHHEGTHISDRDVKASRRQGKLDWRLESGTFLAPSANAGTVPAAAKSSTGGFVAKVKNTPRPIKALKKLWTKRKIGCRWCHLGF